MQQTVCPGNGIALRINIVLDLFKSTLFSMAMVYTHSVDTIQLLCAMPHELV